MEVDIAKDTSIKIEKASQLTGISRQEIIDRALLLYLDSMSKFLDFKQEMKDWDKLSDEAWENFERSL